MILMNDFKKEYLDIKSPVDKAIQDVCSGGWYILGQATKQFEKEFATYSGSTYCVGVANGLEAIQIALMAQDIGPGDEVITVSNSAVATSLAITNVGATAVFVDVDEYYHMDPELLKKAITSRTKAILPVHLFGQMVDMDSIMAIANEHSIPVIEDACQAHGASYKHKKAGSYGIAGCFSFYPTKNLGGYGDGGALITDDEQLYKKYLMLRNYGQENRYHHQIKGINSRLDEIQSAILSVKLKKLDEFISARRRIAKLYHEQLKNVQHIKLPQERKNGEHAYHLFVIEVDRRDELRDYLKANNVECLVHYPIPIHKQECCKEYNAVSLPKTELLANRILSIPIHPYLTEDEVKTVCHHIIHFYKS